MSDYEYTCTITDDVMRYIISHIRDLTTYRNIRSTCKSFSEIRFTQKINIQTNELEATLKSVYSHIKFIYTNYPTDDIEIDELRHYNLYELVIINKVCPKYDCLYIPSIIERVKFIDCLIGHLRIDYVLEKLKFYNSYVSHINEDIEVKKVYYKNSEQRVPFPRDINIGKFSLYWYSENAIDIYSFLSRYLYRDNIKEIYLPKTMNIGALKKYNIVKHFVL